MSRRRVANEAETRGPLYRSQKAPMWERWKKGESLQQIAYCSIEITHQYNGFLPSLAVSALQRQRPRLALSLAEREETSRSLAIGHPIRQIAR